MNATSETIELLRNGNYELIIDETLDVIVDFNAMQCIENAPRQNIESGDIKLLLEKEIIQIDEDLSVNWCGNSYGANCKFSEVERFAKLHRLYCVNTRMFLTVFPPEIFSLFEKVYVLTYMFDASTMKYYFDLFGINYCLKSVEQTEGEYRLVEYSDKIDMEFRLKCNELITICDNPRMNIYCKGLLSKSWYIKSNKESFQKLKNHLSNFFRRILKDKGVRSKDIMWTCISGYEGKLEGAGYTCVRKPTKEELTLTTEEREKLEKELSCFVPCNARATNKYRNRWALAYCVNMYLNPLLVNGFFMYHNKKREKDGLSPIVVNQDAYALSCLIQWIFRSRIRDGQSIYIYIPSQRMRNLLVSWLDNKI